jgi:hypothetical protein
MKLELGQEFKNVSPEEFKRINLAANEQQLKARITEVDPVSRLLTFTLIVRELQ